MISNLPLQTRIASANRLVISCLALMVLASAPTLAIGQPALEGEWSLVFDTQNVMIHASVLPNGKVLFWGRREAGQTLDPHDCTPRLWDPQLGTGLNAFSQPLNKPGFNLFCSGHTFLADGRLFVVGGHLNDSQGSKQSTIYDPQTNKWTSTGDTKGGRWYPTAITLADGGVLVSFGADQDGHLNDTQQVWKDGQWREIVNFNAPPLYPRMHLISDGRVFMSGPPTLTQILDTSGNGTWTPFGDRINQYRDYAPSVLYDENKILYAGGGNPPTKAAEIRDLDEPMTKWKKTDDMHFARRHHNATLLPDGTVLVMGGTQGNGGESQGFDDLRSGQPIRSAEIWNPKTGHWTKMAKASVNRCYHSTAVLLPDATVLSAGGGEYRPKNGVDEPNKPEDTHKNAQIFSPPYLHKPNTTRPDITSAPDQVTYGQTFAVGTSDPNQVGQVSWIRLSSATHSLNSNQRINFLSFTANGASLMVTAPANAHVCPPGHYLIFVLNKDNVPSIAKTIQIQ